MSFVRGEKMTTPELEYAVYTFIGGKSNIVVPNIRWGFRWLPYEVDLLCVTPSGYAHEYELKISASDIAADKRKRRIGCSDSLHTRTFCVPDELIDQCLSNINPTCGLIAVKNNMKCRWIRKPKINKAIKKVTHDERDKLYRLLGMRVWSMKRKMMMRKG